MRLSVGSASPPCGWAGLAMLAIVASSASPGCRRGRTNHSVYYVERIVVSENTLAGNPSVDLDAEGLRQALIRAFSRSGSFLPVLPGSRPPQGATSFFCRAEVAFTRESESSGPDAAGLRAEVGVLVELVRQPSVDMGRIEANGLGRRSFDVSDLAGRRPAFRAALDQALSSAIESLLLQLSALDKPVEALIADLSARDPRVRDYAVRVLADRRNPLAVPRLTERLSDPDSEVAMRAIGALRAIGDRRAVPALIEYTRNRDSAVLVTVVDALGALGGEEAEAYLFTVESGHPDDSVRQAASAGLAALRSRRGRDAELGRQSDRLTHQTP